MIILIIWIWEVILLAAEMSSEKTSRLWNSTLNKLRAIDILSGRYPPQFHCKTMPSQGILIVNLFWIEVLVYALHYSLTTEIALLGSFSSSLHFIHIRSSTQNIFHWNMFRPSIARDTISQLSPTHWVIYCLSRPSINRFRAFHLIQLRLAAISSRLASRRGAMFGRFTCRHGN
jgi:hypothetical protein